LFFISFHLTLVHVLLTPIKNNRRLALEVGQSSVEVALVPVQVQAAVQPTKKFTPRKKLASKPKRHHHQSF
jgi:hypothetical protein